MQAKHLCDPLTKRFEKLVLHRKSYLTITAAKKRDIAGKFAGKTLHELHELVGNITNYKKDN